MERTENAPWARTGELVRPLREAQGNAAGLMAAVAAYLFLWRCRRVGARARALGRPLVANPGNVEIGDDVLIDSRAGAVHLVSVGRGRLVIGHGVRIGPATRIAASRYVEIGDRTRVGARCVVSDAEGAARGDEPEIWIGDGVTLGDDVRVLSGTVIGAGVVVASGSVVSGRIPSGALVGAGALAPAT